MSTSSDTGDMESTKISWDRFRELMPVAKQWAYLDHSAVAPLPAPTADAIHRWCDQAANDGDTVWPQWYQQLQHVRRLAAQMINAAPEEIALVPNTTSGINLVAEGFPWKAGENVVTLANEFPSNLYPWMNQRDRGVETRLIETTDGRVDVQRIAEACDERTRIISVSWVGYSSGWRLDLNEVARVARERDAYLFVDAIQGLGVFPLDVQQTAVDFLAADGHKWMLGPEGAGIFFTRHAHLNLLRPFGVGWHSVAQTFDFDRVAFKLRDSAARYEGGSQNIVGFIGLAESLAILVQHGLSPTQSPIAEQVLQITDYAAERLKDVGATLVSPHENQHRSGILTFRLPRGDPAALRQKCQAAKIALSCRGGGLRISPHAYNREDEIDHLADTVASAAR